MDRIIEVKVGGNYLSKDNKNAGVQHEANVTALRIDFDEGWDGYAKKVTFWDAKGENPVERTLTADLLEDITKSTRIYMCLIPGEALTEAGWCTFVIDGYVDGKRQRSISDKLYVKDAPFQEIAGEPADPTPTQAEQLQVQIDTILDDMAAEATAAVNAKKAAQAAQEAAETAQGKAETAQSAAETAQGKAETYQSKAESAKDAAETAKASAEAAKTAAEAAQDAAETAMSAAESSATAAEASAEAAENSAISAAGSSISAATYAGTAEDSAADALASANAAKASQAAANTSETNAKSSETAAKASENAAKASENAAAASAAQAAEIAGGDFATREELASVKTFIAEYGVTTNSEIQAAVDAEKAVFCLFNGSVFAPLAMSDGATSHTFMVASQDGCLQIVCNDNNWSNENKKHTGVFYAEYDVTTYDEIAAAISAGNDVLLCMEYESLGVGKCFSVLIDSDMGKETEPWVSFCQAFSTKIYIQRCTKQTDGTTLWEEHSDRYFPREHASQHATGGTDAITPADIGAVKAFGFYGGNTVSALDEKTGTGNYSWLAPEINPFGAEEGALFVLVVDCPNYGGNPVVTQTITQVYAAGGSLPVGATFTRSNYPTIGTWSSWEKVYNEGNKPTPEEIGAAPVSDSGTVQSGNADYAEIGEWKDGNTDDEDRIGYFVAVDPSTAGTTMVKATSTMDVRGVTVTAPAFSGNCSADKFDADGNLLKQYDFVAVMGLVSVIDNGTCTINGRCMPTDDGTAVPSDNDMGYQVIDRIDSTHVLIAVEPGADMIQRIKTFANTTRAALEGKADLDESGKVPTAQLPAMGYSKAETLSDPTKSLYGLGADAVPDDVLALIKSLIDTNTEGIANGTKIATGSYTGTGKYGQDNPNSLTFDFPPKIVIVASATKSTSYFSTYSNNQSRIIWVSGMTQIYAMYDSGYLTYLNFTEDENTLTWWETYSSSNSSTKGVQLNTSNHEYVYIALG